MDTIQGILIEIHFTDLDQIERSTHLGQLHARDKQHQSSAEGRRIWNKTPPVSGQRATERPLPLVISAFSPLRPHS